MAMLRSAVAAAAAFAAAAHALPLPASTRRGFVGGSTASLVAAGRGAAANGAARVPEAVADADSAAAAARPGFEVRDDAFWLDGQRTQLRAGDVFYQRIHPSLWEDRLRRVAALGLNAIQVYVHWNWHERRPGQFSWDGDADLLKFLETARDVGLLVLLRVGPYTCAEWDMGGLPWWLLATPIGGGPACVPRTADPAFLARVDAWWGELLPKVRPLLRTSAARGPVLMLQVENEYGAFGDVRDAGGDDRKYIEALLALARKHAGPQALLYTTEQTIPLERVERGAPSWDADVLATVDFAPFATGFPYYASWGAFAAQKKANAAGQSPEFCSELYVVRAAAAMLLRPRAPTPTSTSSRRTTTATTRALLCPCCSCNGELTLPAPQVRRLDRALRRLHGRAAGLGDYRRRRVARRARRELVGVLRARRHQLWVVERRQRLRPPLRQRARPVGAVRAVDHVVRLQRAGGRGRQARQNRRRRQARRAAGDRRRHPAARAAAAGPGRVRDVRPCRGRPALEQLGRAERSQARRRRSAAQSVP